MARKKTEYTLNGVSFDALKARKVKLYHAMDVDALPAKMRDAFKAAFEAREKANKLLDAARESFATVAAKSAKFQEKYSFDPAKHGLIWGWYGVQVGIADLDSIPVKGEVAPDGDMF